MRLLRLRILSVVLVAATAVFGVAGVSSARNPKTWHVNTTLDLLNTCNNTTTLCALRSAIAAAQNGDKIALPGGFYHLTIDSTLDVNKPLTIVGAGPSKTEVVGNTQGQTSFTNPIFTFDSLARATLKGVTLSGGNSSGDGGGVLNNSGKVNLINDVVTDSVAAGEGGGVANNGSGTMLIQASRVANNNAPSGGGVENSGTAILTIKKSTISGNSTGSSGVGGGIINDSTMSIGASTISDNTGGTTAGDGAGGLWALSGDTTIRSSTFSGNSGATGGGLFIQGGTAHITNSTLSSNHATSGTGGGLVNVGATVFLTYATIAENSTTVEGGGVMAASGSTILQASVLGENTGPDPDCWGTATTLISHGYNVIETTNVDCTPNAGAHDSFNVADPNLGALAFNGGPTETQAIPHSSNAARRDASDPMCNGHTRDQRGVLRPDNKCDSGAFEVTH